MSDNIPFEVQEQIIKRVLHVKSLLCFRSVLKQWKSFIDSSEFITHHHNVNQTRPHHLFVSYREFSEDKYISFVDDDSLAHNRFSPTVKLFSRAVLIGCSHGLVCLVNYDTEPVNGNELVVLWNPTIRKHVGIALPTGSADAIGFGVCPKTSDPKIVKITKYEDDEAEVFALSTGTWKSTSMNLSRSLNLDRSDPKQVLIDGVIHWTDYNEIDRYTRRHRIVLFDLTSETFEELDLPHSISLGYVSILKRQESLAVINYNEQISECDVWMMIKNDDPNSLFAKLLSIRLDDTYGFKIGYTYSQIIGFRKNDQVIMEHVFQDDLSTTLEVYEHHTQRSGSFMPCTISDAGFKINSYTESMLLLNHSDDSIIQ